MAYEAMIGGVGEASNEDLVSFYANFHKLAECMIFLSAVFSLNLTKLR